MNCMIIIDVRRGNKNFWKARGESRADQFLLRYRLIAAKKQKNPLYE